ncbi:hypothetical protein DYB32_010186 [Aphanomyces invadans]|uniref:Uncharacterized protein n=1 Tax=Aphanomyces invadans TaxID=157072 RepID=A0A3R6V351_9STRA|nr:hypothetical protein DYB32_010186 [Aphanomyces invadans]
MSEQLIQDLSDVKTNKALKEEKNKKIDKRQKEGLMLREAAQMTMKRKSDALEEEEEVSPSKVKEPRPSSALKDAASAVVDIMSMIDTSNEFKRTEIDAKRESNALMQRKVELGERRYLLDKAERDARFALEQQERQSQLQYIQSTIDLLRSLAKKLSEN